MSPDSVSARSDGPRFTRAGAPPDPEAERVRRSQVRRALFAGTVGTSIEWIFLYGTAAALVFPELFFPGSSPYAGVAGVVRDLCRRVRRAAGRRRDLRSLGRPDRPQGDADHDAAADGYRERPDRRAAGVRLDRVLAPTLLVVLRLLQGVGVGGEWGGSVTLAWSGATRAGAA